jgi:hypothetical protein
MKKYIVYAPHKCGSTIITTILADIFNLPERLLMSQEKTINNDTGEAKLQFEYVVNLKKPANIDYIKDNFIFIPRNPIGITMSMFYSFGYTHKCPAHSTEKQFELNRQKIQKEGLHNYIKNNISNQSTKIEKFWNLPTTNKTILPYELMVNNFGKFLKELLQALDMASVYDKTYEKWKESFAPIEDKSDLIEAGKLKTHKRTTDIHEWKKKLSDEEQSKYLSEFPIIQQYDDFLNKLL